MRPDEDILISRNPGARGSFSLLSEMYLERGTKQDWLDLHELHYKTGGLTIGNYYRCVLDGQLIGVCVMAPPRGLLVPRHALFPQIKPGEGETHITNVHRYRWLNENVTLNTRTVVDTMYRGIGLAYRMLNLAARWEGKRYAEIQSSMSRFNQFAQKAGFKFVKQEPLPRYFEGLKFFKMTFKSNPIDYWALKQEFEALSPGKQEVVLRRTREFYYLHSSMEKTGKYRGNGMSRVNTLPFGEVMKQLQQLVFAQPMYGVYVNPDQGRTDFPERMPLIWFDRQAVDEPLKVD